MGLKDDIIKNHNEVLDCLNNWTEQSFLDSLANLETKFAKYLIEYLNIAKYTKHVKWPKDSEYISNKSTEHIISKIVLWTKVSINDLLNEWIKKFNKNYSPDSKKKTICKGKSKYNYEPLIKKTISSFNINYNIINKPEIQEIINNVRLNRSRNTDHVIRYVVVMVSRLVKRDVNFFFSTEEDKVKLLLTKTYNDYPNVICKTLSELIRDVLYLLWIESRVIVATDTVIPLYALITEWENWRYFIDPLNDLFRSQYRMKPFHYWILPESNNNILNFSELIELSEEFIEDIDINQLKIIEWWSYFDETLSKVKNIFTSINDAKKLFGTNDEIDLIKKKIKYISDNYLNKYQISGPIERATLYIYYKRLLFNKDEKKCFIVKNKNEPWYPVHITIEYLGKILKFEEVKHHGEYSLKQI